MVIQVLCRNKCSSYSLRFANVWRLRIKCLKFENQVHRTIQIHYYSCYLCEATFISDFHFQAIFTLIYHLKSLLHLMHSGGVVHGHEPVAQPEPEPEPRRISGGGPNCKMPIFVPSFFLKQISVFNQLCFQAWTDCTIMEKVRHPNVIQFTGAVTQNIL